MRKLFIVASIASLFLFSCDADKAPDVSHIKIDLVTERFDKKLFDTTTTSLTSYLQQLQSTDPAFTNIFIYQVLGADPKWPADTTAAYVNLFVNSYRSVYADAQKIFNDFSTYEKDIEKTMQYVKYYFPNEKLGDVYYFISGLNSWSAVTVDTALGIGLDMHLGKDYPYYASVQLPEYQIEHCEKEYIPINASKVIYENIFPFEPDGKNLLELMLMKGKQQLFMEYTLPTTNEELLMGYTTKQLEWCKDNEAMIWNYFSAQKLLYSTNWQDVMRYVNEGPNSTGMPPESPGNIGTWIGWQIIRKYMNEHPEKTMVDILKSSMF